VADSHRPISAVSIPHRVPLLCFFGGLCCPPYWQPVAATELLVLCAFLLGCPPRRGRRVICQDAPAKLRETREQRIPVLFLAGQKERVQYGRPAAVFFPTQSSGNRYMQAQKHTYAIHKMGQCHKKGTCSIGLAIASIALTYSPDHSRIQLLVILLSLPRAPYLVHSSALICAALLSH